MGSKDVELFVIDKFLKQGKETLIKNKDFEEIKELIENINNIELIERPDSYLKIGDTVYIIELFKVDNSHIKRKKDGNSEKILSHLNNKLNERFEEDKEYAHVLGEVGTLSYEDYVKNAIDNFNKHYKNISIYKENVKNDLKEKAKKEFEKKLEKELNEDSKNEFKEKLENELKEKNVAIENIIFKVGFFIEDVSPFPTLCFDNNNQIYEISLFQSKEFIEEFKTKEDIDFCLLGITLSQYETVNSYQSNIYLDLLTHKNESKKDFLDLNKYTLISSNPLCSMSKSINNKK